MYIIKVEKIAIFRQVLKITRLELRTVTIGFILRSQQFNISSKAGYKDSARTFTLILKPDHLFSNIPIHVA